MSKAQRKRIAMGALQGAGDAFNQISGTALALKVQEFQKKQALQEAVQKAVLSAALKNMQLRKGADLSQLNTNQGMAGILGQIPQMFERQKAQPSTSISISQRPYSEIVKAQEIAGRTPEDYLQAKMATPGERLKGTGFFGTGYGPGSKRAAPVLSPQAIAEQASAKSILGNPYRINKRVSYKGAIDTAGEDVTEGLPDPTEYEEGTVIENDNGEQFQLIEGQWVPAS